MYDWSKGKRSENQVSQLITILAVSVQSAISRVQTQPSSSPREYDPDDDIVTVESDTPQAVPESQKSLARQPDPRDGRCLIANSTCQAAIEIRHLVARSTDHSIVCSFLYYFSEHFAFPVCKEPERERQQRP